MRESRRLVIVLTAAIGFLGELNCAEPSSKQEPPGNLWSYFLKTPMPNYPQVANTSREKGSGWFRLQINPATGVVTEGKVLKSTGTKVLDDSAAVALMQWRAKPHLIDHAIVQALFIRPREYYTGSHLKW